jgi:uncharacterized membrane protein
MEALIVLVVLVALAAPVLALVALVRGELARRRVRELEDAVRALEARMGALGRRVAQQGAPVEEAAPPAREPAIEAAPPEPRPMPPPPPRPIFRPPQPVMAPPPGVSGALALAAAPVPASVTAGLPPRTPPPRASDFATSLGPRLLIGTGALACVVALALFVKYAWENDWVGPTGRVAIGIVTGASLVLAGLRMLSGRYRPLGQGLAGAGLASCYVCTFAAHAFYDLVPRAAAGALMAAITTVAVLLAARLDLRLLALLAWVSAYLTPVMLSTGEDRALALFLYLALVDLGALVLDHRRPWPETAPLAALGTVLLYGGWFATFYAPARFDMAAFGLVLFTALFALGMARKERSGPMAAVMGVATIGLTVLAGSADRPLPLMVMAVGVAATALYTASRMTMLVGTVALGGAFLPFLAWWFGSYKAESFGIAAAWLVAGLLLFVIRRGEEAPETRMDAGVVIAMALVLAGIVTASMAARTDLPSGLFALLLAQAGVALVARPRCPWAEVIGAAAAAVAVTAWMQAFFKDGRQGEAWLIAFPVAGAYLLSLVGRALIARRDMGVPDLFAHLANATLVWSTLFQALYDTAPSELALSSIALAAVYLALGLVALSEHAAGPLFARTTLGLAAVFITIAIPVRLGLHGITLAWALEGLVLLALGLRYQSALARAGAYAVMALAAARLLVRHLPLHGPDPFTPVLNASFGTWLMVIAALAGAAWMARGATGVAADRVLSVALSVAALGLLFGLLSGEVTGAFHQSALDALRRQDTAAFEQARLRGRVALSLLWTVFATGLLAGGLGLRSRPLFYAGYGLFAVTALKVVLVDTATLHMLYRMLSFLGLGVLLLAGAYLNLRFRERLVPREAAS